jgi:hypothetical protein
VRSDRPPAPLRTRTCRAGVIRARPAADVASDLSIDDAAASHHPVGAVIVRANAPGAVAVLSVNSVQQKVQQQGRTTADMDDRRQRLLAAEAVRSSHAPVVCIERVDPAQTRCGPCIRFAPDLRSRAHSGPTGSGAVSRHPPRLPISVPHSCHDEWRTTVIGSHSKAKAAYPSLMRAALGCSAMVFPSWLLVGESRSQDQGCRRGMPRQSPTHGC